MDVRNKHLVWKDQDVFDIPEAAGVTASRDFLGVLRDKIVEQVNHLSMVAQFIPDLQKEISILKMYIVRDSGGDINNPKRDRWKTDLITKQNEIDHLIARKEVLIISISAIEKIMESITWELKG
jgi:hypothetical protein